MVPTRDNEQVRRNETPLDTVPEKKKQNHLGLPKAMTKAYSGMSHLKVKNIEKPQSARPTTPNLPAKGNRENKNYSKPWLVNT
jgi:hypothetical protein